MFLCTIRFGGPQLRAWGKHWWSKFYQINCQKGRKTVSTYSTLRWISRSFSLLCEEMGSERISTIICPCVGFQEEKFSQDFELLHEISQFTEVRTTIICINTFKIIVGLLNFHIWPTYLNTCINLTNVRQNENILTCSDNNNYRL